MSFEAFGLKLRFYIIQSIAVLSLRVLRKPYIAYYNVHVKASTSAQAVAKSSISYAAPSNLTYFWNYGFPCALFPCYFK